MKAETATKKKVLMSMVGLRDPYAISSKTGQQTEGSILTLFRQVEPDVVILFPTAARLSDQFSDTQLQAAETSHTLKNLLPEAKVLQCPLDLSDPTDYRQLLDEMEKSIISIQKQVQKEFGNNAEYHVNVSSGTAQMHACWLLLVNGGRIRAKVWQVVAPEWQPEGESRCKIVETDFVEEQNKISRARNFFSGCHFKAAQDELELLAAATYNPQRAFLSEIMARICEAYHYWDLFQHDKTHRLLTKVIKSIEKFPELAQLNSKIESQVIALKAILSNKEQESETNLLDLFHNAQRRRQAQQYVDCLARFKRIDEGCQYYYLRDKLGIDAAQRFDRQPKWVKEICTSKRPESFLVQQDIMIIMNKKGMDHPVTDNLRNDIRKFNQQRNKSIIAHGMGTVSEEDAKVAMQLARIIMQCYFPVQDPDEYVFSGKEISQLEKLIFEKV